MRKNKALIYMVLAMLIFSTIGIFRNQVNISSGLLAFYRGLLGSISLFIFSDIRKNTSETSPKYKLLFSGALIGINWLLLFEAFNYTTIGLATLSYYMQPTIVMILSPLIFKDRFTNKKLILILLSLLGMILISGVNTISTVDSKGILCGLAAGFFYALVVIYNKKKKLTSGVNSSTYQLLGASLVMFISLIFTKGFDFINFDINSMVLIVIIGVVHTSLAYGLYFTSLSELNTQTTALLSYVDPILALIFAWLFLGQALSIYQIIESILILGSSLLADLK